jgi:hypothetical protein
MIEGARDLDEITIFLQLQESSEIDGFLRSIANQTYNKAKLHLFVDISHLGTAGRASVTSFLACHKANYNSVFVNVAQVKDVKEQALSYASHNDTHLFMVDPNVLLHHKTLKWLQDLGLEIVAPLLTYDGIYSNFHAAVDSNGYYRTSALYFQILNRELRGIYEIPIVNACYLIRHASLKYVRYHDNTTRAEYVVFSDWLRRNAAPLPGRTALR